MPFCQRQLISTIVLVTVSQVNAFLRGMLPNLQPWGHQIPPQSTLVSRNISFGTLYDTVALIIIHWVHNIIYTTISFTSTVQHFWYLLVSYVEVIFLGAQCVYKISMRGRSQDEVGADPRRIIITHQKPNIYSGSCGGSQVSAVIVLLRLTPMDITSARDAMTLWTFDDISKILHDRATQVDGDSLYNLFIVERFLPPNEFLEAINALTIIQKGHIGELSIGGRSIELNQIMSGIILSLPEEVQDKARNFMELMRALVCLHSTLQEPPYY